MIKVRIQSLEHLVDSMGGEKAAKFAFDLIDQSVKQLRQIGIESDFPEVVILKDVEYRRENVRQLADKDV